MERLGNCRLLGLAGAILMAAGALTPICAQDPDDQQRAVARISLMNGDVSVQRGDSGDWVAGIINAPLLAEDRISTGPNSRAEVQFDSSNVLRIGGNAEIRLTQLEYARYQLELAHGTVTYNVVRASGVNAEVDTPSVAVKPSYQGIYRISVNDSGETEVTVREGQVEVFSPQGSQWVQTGQSLLARGTGQDAEFQIVAANPIDDWDRWNADRDRVLVRAASYQYVPQGVYGAEDLDSNGTWAYVEPYGYCWHPAVAADAGWAPYRTGRWVWEDWYGWTWVSYDPWGWAPYHYGRWFANGGAWWWYPGVMGRRHYWSPALVAFFGFGPGVGVGFGFGNVGWVPLAPYEVFHPWWGRGYYGGGAYIDRRINITNVNIASAYRNARVTNGISGMPAGDFTGGRFHNIRGFQGSQIREAGLVRGQMPIGPTAQNLRFSDRNVGRVPATRQNLRFFSHQQANPVERASFAKQQRTFDPSARSPLPVQSRQSLGNTSPRGAQNPGAEGWRRFGTPGRAPAQQTDPSQASTGAGRFGGSRFAAQPEAQQQPLRVAPPVVRQRQSYSPPAQSAPRYQAPQPRYQAPQPRYQAPRQQSAPRTYSAPARSAPQAPRSNGGGGSSHSGGNRGGRH
jgi:Family of unknown function (DUF6600)/FecR protein